MSQTQSTLKEVAHELAGEQTAETPTVRSTEVAGIVRGAGPEGELGNFWPTVAARQASTETVQRLAEEAR